MYFPLNRLIDRKKPLKYMVHSRFHFFCLFRGIMLKSDYVENTVDQQICEHLIQRISEGVGIRNHPVPANNNIPKQAGLR